MLQIFADDDGTKLALEAYVLAHSDEDWSKIPRFPRLFACKCAGWIKAKLGKETATKIRSALDYCNSGCNPIDGEYPVYVADETWDKWYYDAGPLSHSLRQYATACACGIAPYAALKATSPRLAAMIERAYLLKDRNISDDEKTATAEYFATLAQIKERAYAERDAKQKDAEKKETESNG